MTNYRRNSSNLSKPTESYISVKGNPSDTKRYGKTILCSKGVTFNISYKSSDISTRLCQLILDIEEIIKYGLVLNKFPRIKIERDEKKIQELWKLLLAKIKEDDVSDINLSQYYEKDNKLIFLDQVDKLELYLKGHKLDTGTDFTEYENTYIEQIVSFIRKFEIKDLNDIKVNVIDDNGKQIINLTKLLLVELKSDNKNYILQDGQWGTFNSEFLELLNSSLEDIEVKFHAFDNVEEYKNDEDGYIDKIIEKGNGNFKKLHKSFVKSKNDSFRMLGQGIELADIIDVDSNELFTVKMGLDSAISMYSLEQNMLSTSALIHSDTFEFKEIINVLNEQEFKNLKETRNNSLLWVLPFTHEGDPFKDKTHSNNVKQK